MIDLDEIEILAKAARPSDHGTCSECGFDNVNYRHRLGCQHPMSIFKDYMTEALARELVEEIRRLRKMQITGKVPMCVACEVNHEWDVHCVACELDRADRELKRTREEIRRLRKFTPTAEKEVWQEAYAKSRDELQRTRELLEECRAAMQSAGCHLSACCDPFVTARNSINSALSKLRSVSPQGEKE